METTYLDLLPSDEDSAPAQEEDIIEEKIESENIKPTIKLDYKLKTCEERAALVSRIIQETPHEKLSNRYLEILGDYIMGGITKEERRSHKYLTDNRMITVSKRETSFEGLAEKFENGEDGIYQLMSDNKNFLLTPKIQITQEDIDTIPGLRDLREQINNVEEALKSAMGRQKYLLKKQLIEMRRDQYVLKNSFKPTMAIQPSPRGVNKIDLSERRYFDQDGNPQSDGLISFFNPQHVSALLNNYNGLHLETQNHYTSDFCYLMDEFDALIKKTFAAHPQFAHLISAKFAEKQNAEIQKSLQENFNLSYSIQYISFLWCNKIPKMIAEQAKKDYVIWYYTTEKPNSWKRCSCCHKMKPKHSYFFSKNSTAKDGWYSMCKECRNKKK